MTDVGTAAAADRRAARALVVLTVLFGLLAMHGLTSTHHAAATTTTAQRSATQHQAPLIAHHHAAAAVQHDGDVLAAPAPPRGGDDCPDLAVLCVAILLGATLLARLLARRGPVRLLPAPVRHGAATRAPPVRHARGPDPVKELCVSRT